MPHFLLLEDPDHAFGEPRPAVDGEAMLRRRGVHWGRVAAPASPGSPEPRLRHARALIGLQRHFGAADHVLRRRAGTALHGDPRRQDHDELTLVVGGTYAWLLPEPALGGWLLSRWSALEWFALPAGLPHRHGHREADPDAEWLVLQRRRRPGAPSGRSSAFPAAPPLPAGRPRAALAAPAGVAAAAA